MSRIGFDYHGTFVEVDPMYTVRLHGQVTYAEPVIKNGLWVCHFIDGERVELNPQLLLEMDERGETKRLSTKRIEVKIDPSGKLTRIDA